MTIKLQSSGGGNVSLTPPVTASNFSLALPAANGSVPYINAAGDLVVSGRVVPSAKFFRLNADLAGANATGAQSIFGKGVTLDAGTVYAFEAAYTFSKTAGTAAHNFNLGYGGTATLNNIAAVVDALFSSTALSTANQSNITRNTYGTSAQSSIWLAASAATINAIVTIKGTVSINAAGTFIPQYSLSAAPGGAYSTAAGSYFLIYPIGTAGADVNVGGWA